MLSRLKPKAAKEEAAGSKDISVFTACGLFGPLFPAIRGSHSFPMILFPAIRGSHGFPMGLFPNHILDADGISVVPA